MTDSRSRPNWSLRYWTCQNLLSARDVEPASRKDFVQLGIIAYSLDARLLRLEQALLPLGKFLPKVQSNPVTVNIVDINTLYISF
ncbi:hypothetical protein [Nostoc sp. DSM 114161]|uniref:hypothetical protein n=1 Tax=Nostoc sp. DSM 114161 TaxID=3440143 RepID=UPI0040458CAA